MSDLPGIAATDGERIERVLVAQHRRLLDLLRRRTGSAADAEEILQAAYARALEKGLPDADVTANNASVRLHRARRALKEQLLRACGACAAHGCLECSCRRR